MSSFLGALWRLVFNRLLFCWDIFCLIQTVQNTEYLLLAKSSKLMFSSRNVCYFWSRRFLLSQTEQCSGQRRNKLSAVLDALSPAECSLEQCWVQNWALSDQAFSHWDIAESHNSFFGNIFKKWQIDLQEQTWRSLELFFFLLTKPTRNLEGREFA